MADCTLNIRAVIAAVDVQDPIVVSFEQGDKFSYVPNKGKKIIQMLLLTSALMSLIV
jgi:hypothetical protein